MTPTLKPVAEFCSLVTSGGTPSSGNASYYGGEIPWLRTQEVTFNRIADTEIKITESGLKNSAAKWIPAGSVIVAMYGASAGRVATNSIALTTNQACCNLIVNEESDFRYLYYALVDSFESLAGAAKGAAQNNLNAGQVKEFRIPWVPKENQSRIADRLWTIDDLIENNRRRIKLLEEAARLIYREWFVRLRFPGHEHTKIENGIPEGWNEQPIEGALESHIGGGWGQDDPLGQEIEPAYVIRGTDFPAIAQGDFGKVGLRYHKPGPLTKRVLSAGDIIFEVSGGSATQPIARTVYVTDRLISAFNAPVICASFCKKFRPISAELGLYLHLTFKEDRANGKLLTYQKQSASALLNYNFEAFLSGYRVRVPGDSVLNEFYQAVFPLLDQCTILAMQNKKLNEARDLLLPRFMSGEIVV